MKKVIFIDCGDTLVDEGTQVFGENEVVVDVLYHPDAEEALNSLKEEGFTIILVADGLDKSFRNIFNKIGFMDKFDGFVISENVGVLKPDSKMFETAYNLLSPELKNKENIVMIGNNLRRDIKGANNFGITSIWMNWSERYYHEIEEEDEKPDYEIKSPKEILDLLKNI